MSFLASLLVSAAAVTAPLPQSSDLVRVLISQYDHVPGLPAGYQLNSMDHPVAGRDGGWLASASGRLPALDHISLILGQRPDGIDGPVGILRRAELLQGLQQINLTYPTMANGVVAYLADSPIVAGQYGSHAWVEDQLIAEDRQPVAGSPGWVWETFGRIEITTSGQVYLSASVVAPTGDSQPAIWRWPDEQFVLGATSGTPFNQFHSGLDLSPDGSRWITLVRESPTNRITMILNGAVHETHPGFTVRVGDPVHPDISGTLGPAIWERFNGIHKVNDQGDIMFHAVMRSAAGELRPLWVRNGRRYSLTVGAEVHASMDERGALIYLRANGNRLVDMEGYSVLRRDFGVDIDGDGVADPMGSPTSSIGFFADPNPQHLMVSRGLYQLPSGQYRHAYFRGPDVRVDLPVCEGRDNSTGDPAQLIACGSRVLADNEVSLRVLGLPTGSSGYVITSRSAGFAALPGGSQGDLCLSGDIGRITEQVFTSDVTGRASVRFRLSAIPQPTMDVAAMAGERWYVQAWYRDAVQGTPTSNFSSASVLRFE